MGRRVRRPNPANRWPKDAIYLEWFASKAVDREYSRKRKELLWIKRIPASRIRWATCVVTTAILIPQWARERTLPQMDVEEHKVWFRGRMRVDAKRLMLEDEAAGGTPDATQVEWRLCPVCERPLMGLDAERRRKTNEMSREGRQQPCGPECVVTRR